LVLIGLGKGGWMQATADAGVGVSTALMSSVEASAVPSSSDCGRRFSGAERKKESWAGRRVHDASHHVATSGDAASDA
jgi:LmbE family N-acetylglucosaminyl deacetylase